MKYFACRVALDPSWCLVVLGCPRAVDFELDDDEEAVSNRRPLRSILTALTVLSTSKNMLANFVLRLDRDDRDDVLGVGGFWVGLAQAVGDDLVLESLMLWGSA